jgi:hypothetical protein
MSGKLRDAKGIFVLARLRGSHDRNPRKTDQLHHNCAVTTSIHIGITSGVSMLSVVLTERHVQSSSVILTLSAVSNILRCFIDCSFQVSRSNVIPTSGTVCNTHVQNPIVDTSMHITRDSQLMSGYTTLTVRVREGRSSSCPWRIPSMA